LGLKISVIRRLNMYAQRGFTLVEVMVAMVILTIMFLALTNLQIVAIKAVEYGRRFSVAEKILTAEAEFISTQGYDNVAQNNIASQMGNNYYSSYDQLENNYKFLTQEQQQCGQEYERCLFNQVEVERQWQKDQDQQDQDQQDHKLPPYRYVLKLGVDTDYLGITNLARCQLTAYWQYRGKTHQMTLVFFVRKQ